MELTAQQLSGVEMVKKSRVSILTGGPGTGKTTTCKEIIRQEEADGNAILCCAPSGKAAKRMTESTGHEATTIHRMLQATMEYGSWRFNCNRDNPIDCDLLIVDEVSMVDNALMYHLITAVPETARILLVGDADQLPSISCGAVLQDIIVANIIPHVELNIIHRNCGDIVKGCHQIKSSHMPTFSEKIDLENGLNFRHIECSDLRNIQEIVVDLATNKLPLRGYDPLNDIQVLTATNEKTDISCDALNTVLRKKLNPESLNLKNLKNFCAGDKIINTKNERLKDEMFVINGDMGFIWEEVKGRPYCEFDDPYRRVPLTQIQHNLLWAYTITVHRFQGSEAPIVIIPIHKSTAYLLTRAWLYTAISRAKDICIIVGQKEAVAMAVQNNDSSKRLTRLKDILCEKKNQDVLDIAL